MNDPDPRTQGIERADLQTMADRLADGSLTCAAAVEFYRRRIDALDRAGPCLRSVIELNPDALSIAAQADRNRPASNAASPLAGVCVLLKDNIDTADAMLTTAGSLALVSSRPTRDAFIVERLRAAGAVILGKTNLSEWANYRGRGSTGGWSGRGGQTRNPYRLDRSPSGSSSGSAVAVAAGLAAVAVGTETNGSIVSPASACGVVGLKPTIGLVSRSGILPLAASFDTAGPLARTVADAAALLNVLAGPDPGDASTAELRDSAIPDYRRGLDPDSLKGARLGVLRQYTGLHDGLDAVFERALVTLRACGAVIVDPVEVGTLTAIGPDASLVMRYEFKDGLNRYLAGRAGGGPRTLEELIAFNETERDREMPFFGQSLFLRAREAGPLTDPTYRMARQRVIELAGNQGIDMTLARDRLDALIAPTSGPAGVLDWTLGDRSVGGGVGFGPAMAGFPHLSLPMGLVHGLPVGLSLIGARWSEARLLGLGHAFEQARGPWPAPRFLSSLEGPAGR